MPSVVTSTGAVELFPRNSVRKSLAIENEDTTDSVFIKFERSENTTVSSTVHDWKIPPGGSLSLNSSLDGSALIKSRVTIIASANTPRVAFFESEDAER